VIVVDMKTMITTPRGLNNEVDLAETALAALDVPESNKLLLCDTITIDARVSRGRKHNIT
jgi:hypothetical protein